MSEKIIYLKGDPARGETFVLRRETVKPIRRFIDRLLLISGLIFFLVFLSPMILLEARWRLGLFDSKTTLEQKTAVLESGFGKLIRETDVEILQPSNTHFSVVIPKIGVNSSVFANIPIDDQEMYDQILKKGVAHAAGSFLPGQKGSIYLIGHSTNYIWNVERYNAVFFLLKELKANDMVNVFYQGKRFTYRVLDRKILEADDPEILTANAGEEKLVLITCWPPGTVWKRLAVFTKKV